MWKFRTFTDRSHTGVQALVTLTSVEKGARYWVAPGSCIKPTFQSTHQPVITYWRHKYHFLWVKWHHTWCVWTCLTYCYDECLPYMDITQHMWSPMWQVGSSSSANIRWNIQLWLPDRHQKNQCTMKQASLTKCQPRSWQNHWAHIQQATLSLNFHISRWHILLPNS